MTTSASRARRVPHAMLFLVVTVTLLGLNFRAPVLSISPLLETISSDTGLSAAMGGLLTTIPVICFGAVSPLAPWLARRFSMEQILTGVLIILTAGIAIRIAPSPVALFGGTVVVGSAIAVGNVIVPGFIKREAPGHVGPMTAVYSAAISLSGALGAGLTIPIMNALDLGWRQALVWPAMMAIPALAAMLPWLAQARNARHLRHTHHAPTGIWRNHIAWLVSGYMGLQSFVFFGTMGWLPTYLISEGMSEAQAGAMVALSPLAGVVGSFSAPLLVHRRDDQRWLVWVSSALTAAGIIGFILAPTTLTIVWTSLFGCGCGMILSLALAFIGLRTPDSRHAADLSGMAQTVGYLIAAIGPFGLGLVFDLVGDWTLPFVLILIVCALMTIIGLGAAKDRLVAPVTE